MINTDLRMDLLNKFRFKNDNIWKDHDQQVLLEEARR